MSTSTSSTGLLRLRRLLGLWDRRRLLESVHVREIALVVLILSHRLFHDVVARLGDRLDHARDDETGAFDLFFVVAVRAEQHPQNRDPAQERQALDAVSLQA